MRRALAMATVPVLLAGCAWIERSSVPASPVLGIEGNAFSGRPSLSQRGEVVAFHSAATNLVAGDTNGVIDIFVRAHASHVTERVSVAGDGTQANGESLFPVISDDGNVVAFESRASSLVPGEDGDAKIDIFVRDRGAGTTTLVSVQPNGDPFLEDAINPEISGNGRFVSFSAYARFGEDLCCALTGPWVRDLVNGTTTLMPPAGGGLLSSDISAPLSDDGTRIAYVQLTPLDDGTGDATYAVVVADTATATVVATPASGRLSHQSQARVTVGLAGNGHRVALLYGSTTGGPLMTYDLDAPGLHEVLPNLVGSTRVELSDKGNVIAFQATIGGVAGWYVTNAAGKAPKNMSADAEGAAGTLADIEGSLSGNGKWVAFSTADPDMVRGDTNGTADVFTRSVKPSRTGPPPVAVSGS
jgi:Tol biopolymer transport system component